MKILVVDDSKTSRLLFRAYMPKDGQHQVFEAAALVDALAVADEARPDVVVLDYNMPELNGVEMAKVMRDAGVDAGFVLLTANMQQSVVDAAMTAGFVKLLEKPISAAKISDLLAQVGDGNH